jgi:Fic family protein
MFSLRVRDIAGKKYNYAEYSFRLPEGKIKKISKYVRDKDQAGSREIRDYFMEQEDKAHMESAIGRYKPDNILTKEEIGKLELIRLNYKRIIRKLTPLQLKDVLDRFTVNFTYETNALEGNSLTLKDVTLILNENVVPKEKDLREVYETRNTRQANEILFKRGIKITREGIIRLHSILIKDTGVSSGFKKIPNFLLMRDVNTTLPENVEKEMAELIEWHHQNEGILHPLKLAAHFHAIFERIHPFEDGNGRTGRILQNAILVNAGFPPIIIRKTMRVSYLSALAAYDNGYKDKLMRFNIEKLKETYEKFFLIYMKYL